MGLQILLGERVKKSANHNHGSAATLFSAGYWVKPVGSSNFTGDDLSNHNGLHRHRGATGNVPQERVWTNPSGALSLTSSTAFTNDAWNFVVVTSDSATGQKVYLNAVEVASGAVLEPMATIAAAVEYLGDAIPNWDAGDSAIYGGTFRIAGKALSLAEVQALYANRTGGGGSAAPQDHVAAGVTVSCAPMDQTTGTVTAGDSGLGDLGDVGNPWTPVTGTPVWVNDNPGHTWNTPWALTRTSPDSYIPPNTARLLHGGDVRVLQLADSFGSWALLGRAIPMGLLLVDARIRLTAFASGHFVGAANGILKAQNSCTGTTYEISTTSYEVENGSGSYFGLPIHDIFGVKCDVGLALNGGTRFTQHLFRNAAMGTDGVRPWIAAGDRAFARTLFLAANSAPNQLPDIQLKDANAATTVDCDLSTDGCRPRYIDGDDPATDPGVAFNAGEINATYPDIELANTANEFKLDILKGATDPVGTNQFLQIAGSLLYLADAGGARKRGLYFTTLDGSSWSYAGFYANAAATGPTSKQFSRAQVRPWLDATTLDPDQRVVIVQNLADEINSQANHKTKLESLITEGDAWCSGITTQPPLYLFIVQFAHEMDGNPDNERDNQVNKTNACWQVAQANPRVGYISLFQMMDGNYPTTDAKAGATVQAAYTAWAAARGWDAYTNGVRAAADVSDDLLDAPNALHLAGQDEAMAVASLIAEAVTRSDRRGVRSRVARSRARALA